MSASQINLIWTASTDDVGVIGYQVDRCQGAGCSAFVQVATPTGASFTDTGLTAGTSHSYRVRATDAAGNLSEFSNVASATTGAATAQLHFIHTDHLNSPRLITNGTGQAVWRWEQGDPFGGNPPNENPSGLGNFTCNLRLPGQYFDKETNTHYNMARDYDPAIGRYVQSDPAGLLGGINTYAYVRGNPLSNSDPSGLGLEQLVNPLVWGPPLIIGGIWVYNNPQAAKALWKEICKEDDEKARCRDVLKTCREKCLDQFVKNPNGLPGTGSDYAGRQRRCIRECMEENRCFDF